MRKAFILAIAAFSALNAAVAQDAGDFIRHGKAQKIVKENWTKTDYDFNGDGYDDFFVIDTYDTRFGIYINDKKGAYDRLYYTKKPIESGFVINIENELLRVATGMETDERGDGSKCGWSQGYQRQLQGERRLREDAVLLSPRPLG